MASAALLDQNKPCLKASVEKLAEASSENV